MDLSFLLRAERLVGPRHAAQLDFGLLVATLGAHQEASAAGRAAAAPACRRTGDGESEALIELLTAGPAWREARRAQRGSFSRVAARAAYTCRKGPSPARLPSHFSLPSTVGAYKLRIEAPAWGAEDILRTE